MIYQWNDQIIIISFENYTQLITAYIFLYVKINFVINITLG
jgi:hypothetical protein